KSKTETELVSQDLSQALQNLTLGNSNLIDIEQSILGENDINELPVLVDSIEQDHSLGIYSNNKQSFI
ncbi:5295_t:CDS:1, partial [Funneliformis geosporum]